MSLEMSAASGGRSTPIGVLARLATTGIYLVRGIPRDLQGAARARAATEGTTVHAVLQGALREYVAGTWAPRPESPRPGA